MANFSVNQSHQFYGAVNATSYASAGTAKGQISKVVKTTDDQLYFLFNGVDTVLKSDDIDLNTLKVEVIDATKNTTTMKKVQVALNATPVVGQDYILGINFKNFFSSGDASQYYKDAAVHVSSDIDNAYKFFTAMKNALDLAFSRENNATSTSNPYLTFTVTGSGATAKLEIEEKKQEWELGTKKGRRIMFDLTISTIYTGGDDVIWGTATDITFDNVKNPSPTVIGNGEKIADLEWFCAGERGDQYRNVGWPNVIPTHYLIDSTKQYDLIEMHFAFKDSGIGSYRTEKEITIAAPYNPDGGNAAAKHASINLIIGAINTAYGSTLITPFS